MSVAVRDIDGVDSVSVSLNDGLAVVSFSTDNHAPVAEIRRAIRENGFSPKSAEIVMVGIVERTGDGMFLRVPEGNQHFRLEAHPDAAPLSWNDMGPGAVLVEGDIPETDGRGSEPLMIQVRTAKQAGQP